MVNSQGPLEGTKPLTDIAESPIWLLPEPKNNIPWKSKIHRTGMSMELSNDPKSKLGDFTYLGDVSNLLL